MSGLTRETKETRVRLTLGGGPGTGRVAGADRAAAGSDEIVTDDPFLTHMLITLARYAGLPLGVRASGDLRHHLVEDVAIALGTLLGRETPAACARYGSATIPMDDALVQAVLDAGGRPHFEGTLPSDLYDHFFRSLALNAGWTLHIRVLRGRDRHHIVEAAFKALGLAVRQALADTGGPTFSTKGSVAVEWDADLDEIEELGPVPGERLAGPGRREGTAPEVAPDGPDRESV